MEDPEELSPVTALHRIMEQVGGDLCAAAAVLGITPPLMRRKLMEHPETCERWLQLKVEPPTQAESLHHPKAVRIEEDDSVEIAKAFTREDGDIQKGLYGMGLSDEAITMVNGLVAFGTRFFQSSYQIANASATKTIINLQLEYDRTSARLAEVRQMVRKSPTIEERAFYVSEEKGLMDVLNTISDQIRKMLATSNQAIQTMAIIQEKKEMKKAGGGKRSKPGFAEVDDNTPPPAP